MNKEEFLNKVLIKKEPGIDFDADKEFTSYTSCIGLSSSIIRYNDELLSDPDLENYCSNESKECLWRFINDEFSIKVKYSDVERVAHSNRLDFDSLCNAFYELGITIEK